MREHPGTSEIEFAKEMAPFFHDRWISSILDPRIPAMQNTDGEDLLITRVRFDVFDPGVVESVLDSSNELEREEEDKPVWHWSGSNQHGKPVILGRLVLEPQSLELGCGSVLLRSLTPRSRPALEALTQVSPRRESL